jgi:hypothetical protein
MSCGSGCWTSRRSVCSGRGVPAARAASAAASRASTTRLRSSSLKVLRMRETMRWLDFSSHVTKESQSMPLNHTRMPVQPAAAACQLRHTQAAEQQPGICRFEVTPMMFFRTPSGRADQSLHGSPAAAIAAGGGAAEASMLGLAACETQHRRCTVLSEAAAATCRRRRLQSTRFVAERSLITGLAAKTVPRIPPKYHSMIVRITQTF